MPVDIIVPSVGESVTSGVLSRWVKKEGEFAAQDEIIYELETDKVTFEGRAAQSGIIHPAASEGATVQVGAKIGSLEPAAAPAAGTSQESAKSSPAKAASSKSEPAKAEPVAAKTPASSPSTPAESADTRLTPSARKLAEEFGVKVDSIVGTGPGHRIREQDVLAAIQARNGNGTASHAAASAPAAAPASTSKATGNRAVTRDRMTPIRQRIATRLVEAQHTAAMLTTFNEVDMTAVMELRKAYKEEFEKKHAVGLGFMGFFVKATASALQAFPMVNAYLVQEGNETLIEKHGYCDIAVAVSTPKGLVVPVLRNTESMSISGVESGIKDLASRAKEGKIGLDEMQGGTFTITNGGVFGSLMSTPILNPPQSAILGMHAIKNRAMEFPLGSGQVAIRPMMYLALSYDHRIIDGSEAVQFLVHIKKAIEDPQRLLLAI